MTKKGAELAARLARALPSDTSTSWLLGKCSTLTRHAAAYATIQERWCNEEMGEAMAAAVRKREDQLERMMSAIIAELPAPIAREGHAQGQWTLEFGGDPRGAVVTIPEVPGWHELCDCWSGDAIFVG